MATASPAPVLLNMDVGELPGEPDALYAIAQIANIACGGHAGDDASMRRALTHCAREGARAGAHPSYADREGFGRTVLDVTANSLAGDVFAQCARLANHAGELGVTLAYVKPHGALYHAANVSRPLADAVVRAMARALGHHVTLIAPPRGALRDAALAHGLAFAGEAFADRGTRSDGSLVPRGEPGALVTDATVAAAQATRLVSRSHGHGDVATICVHGDTPHALEIARAVRAALARATST